MTALTSLLCNTNVAVPQSCPYCGREIKFSNPIAGLGGRRMPLRCPCVDETERKIAEDNKRREVEYIRANSRLGRRYRDASFASIRRGDPTFDAVTDRLQRYCSAAADIKARGLGFYLHGAPGGGKTYLAACTANALMDKGYAVICTTFRDIALEIRGTYGSQDSELKVLRTYRNAEFLVIDDLGSENVSRNKGDNAMQELMFDITDYRVKNVMPTIFTSNYSVAELSTHGVDSRTTDRISLLCKGAIIRAELRSQRLERTETAL